MERYCNELDSLVSIFYSNLALLRSCLPTSLPHRLYEREGQRAAAGLGMVLDLLQHLMQSRGQPRLSSSHRKT